MKKYALVVAGGKGIRMQGTTPKQFLSLAGIPVIMHTLSCFDIPGIERILVMNKDFIPYWKSLCHEYNFDVTHALVEGGNTRADSVLNGLRNLDDESLVAVHDGVRPFVSVGFIQTLYEEAEKNLSAVPVLPIKETLRELNEEGSFTVNRERYISVQTPQVFHTGKLKLSFNIPGYGKYTDEASLFQAAGNPVHLVAGEENNIKLTVPSDMIIAEAYLKGRN